MVGGVAGVSKLDAVADGVRKQGCGVNGLGLVEVGGVRLG